MHDRLHTAYQKPERRAMTEPINNVVNLNTTRKVVTGYLRDQYEKYTSKGDSLKTAYLIDQNLVNKLSKKVNHDDLVDIITMNKPEMLTLMNARTVIAHPDCWFVPSPNGPANRVTLVAHIDTVWDRDREAGKGDAYYDREKNVLWSPNGLGADDRAGVFSLLYIYDNMPDDQKPNLLFCDFEESGGIGAERASEVFEGYLKHSLFFIELDRRGHNDAVFYCDEPKSFVDYIQSFGFKKDWGTFSDIAEICPATKLCGVNLSIGFVDEHHETEMLFVNDMFRTIKRVMRIINDAHAKGNRWDNLYARTWRNWNNSGNWNSFYSSKSKTATTTTKRRGMSKNMKKKIKKLRARGKNATADRLEARYMEQPKDYAVDPLDEWENRMDKIVEKANAVLYECCDCGVTFSTAFTPLCPDCGCASCLIVPTY
jgi:hypothetical protein